MLRTLSEYDPKRSSNDFKHLAKSRMHRAVGFVSWDRCNSSFGDSTGDRRDELGGLGNGLAV
jgi:hypothetical protein